MRTITAVILFAALTTGAYAADIERMGVSPEPTAIKIVPANQFVICDGCPSKTRLTRLNPHAQMPPASIRFSQPLTVAMVDGAKTEPERESHEEKVESLAVVYFHLNRDSMKGGEQAKLLSHANEFKMADKLTVKGYTCDLGSKGYNDRLALRRAEKVSRYLQSLGVSVAKVEVSGEGLCCYASRDRAKNRRVEVLKRIVQ